MSNERHSVLHEVLDVVPLSSGLVERVAFGYLPEGVGDDIVEVPPWVEGDTSINRQADNTDSFGTCNGTADVV